MFPVFGLQLATSFLRILRSKSKFELSKTIFRVYFTIFVANIILCRSFNILRKLLKPAEAVNEAALNGYRTL